MATIEQMIKMTGANASEENSHVFILASEIYLHQSLRRLALKKRVKITSSLGFCKVTVCQDESNISIFYPLRPAL